MQQFIDDEAGYLAWINANPQGLVVNSARVPVSNYLKLHRATCTFIKPPRTNFTTTGYIKSCSLVRAELAEWANVRVGGLLESCSFCKPDDLANAILAVTQARPDKLATAATADERPTDNSNRPPEQSETLARFAEAVATIEERLTAFSHRLVDDKIETTTRQWLDGKGPPLAWSGPGITPDEWFFITTLYGEMNAAGQRTHIRKLFPMFIAQFQRDIRNFQPQILENWSLRSGWMKTRLCRMASILHERQMTMSQYVEYMRQLERCAGPSNPIPAFDAIVRDHRASGWKTLSVFIRDCVKGNCFPIDTRVQKLLREFGLPEDERVLVSYVLQLGKSPRHLARLFFEAGGEPTLV